MFLAWINEPPGELTLTARSLMEYSQDGAKAAETYDASYEEIDPDIFR